MASQEIEKQESQDGVRLTEVQLKVVDETLEVLQKFDQKLSLECKRVGKACKVCLRNGKIAFRTQTHLAAGMYVSYHQQAHRRLVY